MKTRKKEKQIAEKIAAFIESEIESLKKSFIRKIEEVNDWY